MWRMHTDESCADVLQEDWQTEYKAREDRNSSNVYVVGLPIGWSKDVSIVSPEHCPDLNIAGQPTRRQAGPG